ncbi:uncharacterized protein LOC128193387 isoform X1 [Vigna angularis]|uniref:uncharacterized protein LOC128193387 isoform X1 n=1 Tax=Phaseolus angularis TaxID=3914 RepID=UPI0022B50A3D|nr:uncharacterized protein LOC128193387 isoform X1 [Vigna angularis]
MRVDSANIYNSDSAFLFLPPSPLLSYRTEVSECGGCWWLRWHLLSEAVMDVDVSWRVWEASHTSSQILQLPMILYEHSEKERRVMFCSGEAIHCVFAATTSRSFPLSV